MKISELARRTNTSIRSLRYYETKHLLSPHREDNGYRSYDKTAIERVSNIQFYLRLGLTAHQIFHIVWCGRLDGSASPFDEIEYPRCPEVVELYKAKLAEIEEHIATLEQTKTYLRQRLAFLTSAETPEVCEKQEQEKGVVK
ncbi:MAG TPA: MerR family transcriptional regulator [Ktedonobacterales bacterium]|nr:MerR family transcriptional regulator [Ktedonobacterales bacterium]